MKQFVLIPVLLMLFSCGSTKSLYDNSEAARTEVSCPENGNCTFEVLKNKSLVVKKDGIDKMYYSTIDNSATSVIKYRYVKKTNPALQDAGYVEEIVFEIANNSKALDYKNSDMQQTKMLFGVMCFCKDKAGYYEVKEGALTYKNNKLEVMLPDLVEGQKLKEISVTF